MRTLRTTWAPVLLGVVGVGIALSLGFWQLERLRWKRGLIAKLEERMKADPVDLPKVVDRKRDHMLRVKVTGWISSTELHVLHSIKRFGPGFRVISPMHVPGSLDEKGPRIMVDLGFVPERLKSLTSRNPAVRLKKRLPMDKVQGFLYWPDEADGWTPPPDEKRGIWFARDVAAMARKLGARPVLLVAERHPDGKWPMPLPPGADLPNRHLEYVITWFSLALAWTIMAFVWWRAERRRAHLRRAEGAV